MRFLWSLLLLVLFVQGPVLCYGQGADSVAWRVKYRYVAQETGLFVPLAEDVPAGHYSGITKLYVVDSLRAVYADGLWCGNVGKTLLLSFTTGALGLANYEGMCLGPVLPDGRLTLVMIADSPGGSKGRILESVKVIALQAVPEYVQD